MLQWRSSAWRTAQACVCLATVVSGASAATTVRPLELGGQLTGPALGDVLAYDPTRPGGPWLAGTFNPGVPGGFDYVAGAWGPYWSVMPAHFDANGLADVLLYNRATGHWVLELNTGGGFTQGPGGTWPAGGRLFTGDFNGDGLDDILFYDPALGTRSRCINTGDANAFSCTWGQSWAPNLDIAIGDFSGDGRSDVFAYDPQTGAWSQYVSDPGAPDGFATPRTGFWSPRWQVLVASLNGDARADLFLYDPVSGLWSQRISTGDSQVFTSHDGQWSAGWQVFVADLDADGVDDVFVYAPETGRWFEYRTNPIQGGVAPYRRGRFGREWTVHATDFDADGRADLFLYRPGTGDYAQCLNRVGNWSCVAGQWNPAWSIATRVGEYLAAPVLPPPSIASITPQLGPVEGGTPVTIDGANFLPGAQVYIGTAPATDVAVVGTATITATTPPGPGAGVQDLHVINPDGQAGVKYGAFNYIGTPTTPVLTTPHMLCFGDSITQGVTSFETSLLAWFALTGQLIDGYPPRLQALLQARYPNQQVLADNQGIGGEYVTTQGQDRLTALLPASSAELVILLEGVNDLAANVQDDKIIGALRTMTQTARAAGKKVILMTLTPVVWMSGTTVYKGATEAQVLSLNTKIIAMVASENPGGGNDLVLVDMHAAFGADPTPLLSPDGLHPNATGYQVMAQALHDAIVARYQVLQ